MKEKLDYNQLENLMYELDRHDIPSDIVLSLLSIESLAELSVVQYNYLIYIIKSEKRKSKCY